jgi:glycerol uptake facilitator-like aquaporin
MNRALIVEFIGTFFLSLVVILSLSGNYPVATPILAGFVLTLFVYTIGGISGCHINPGVTIGQLSLKKIRLGLAAQYIIVQLLGAVAAMAVAGMLSKTIVPMSPPAIFTSYFFECLGMVLFTFGVCSIVLDEKKTLVSGVVIGGSLFLGISLSILGGGAGILNPAVAVALRTLDPIVYVVEILGGIIGFQLYMYVFKKK